ncbi:hypothetical protein LshimejAT787_2200550 [Lyophyllum shimeji]|uniref:Uncharacterized protein n=1 Tax=Lyophyllum shimeji TaxID=47721 RepID=A0A9P3Q230_LYOSH|nr:hypothetical protein LshimejAT787_2200550 [Lyophyllum shimeji]
MWISSPPLVASLSGVKPLRSTGARTRVGWSLGGRLAHCAGLGAFAGSGADSGVGDVVGGRASAESGCRPSFVGAVPLVSITARSPGLSSSTKPDSPSFHQSTSRVGGT